MGDPVHLVHGMGTGLEAPSWPAIAHDEAQAVLAMFPEAGRLETLDWHSPRPFSSAALAQTDRGALFLKRHHRRLRSVAGLAGEHAFIAHLRARGVPVVDVLATRDGASAFAGGDWVWEVHRKAQGLDLYRDRQSWTPFLSLDHAHAAGAALARLHLAAQGFVAPARPALPLVTSLSILTAADPLAAAEDYVAARAGLADYLSGRDWRHELAALFDGFAVDRLAEDLAREPGLWTHNDWHPSNLLWTEAGDVASVLDFGLSDRTCALHDLATALERCAVRWLDLTPDRQDVAEPDAARALLAGYHAVRPLSVEDRALLARLLPLVHVEFAMSEADYFHGVLARKGDADLAWDSYLFGHAHWFLTAPGRDLLDVVARG
ncbi:aminoglycoside phosphotransferase [Novosphingobium nitrogenifigens DSM 19370]|uniref:Aminoglycoside phosphotransferase n=1 Tax=Novosphingobium nitrogenifigens DSM 19370 TaxID=983920 RepID=F1Z3R1_9SPHN|nr:phosphotransferase [Novosphingobium nitrogenifigens]EGD60658.1 aminoglycoside phosphotransferase [Novosphingobium nitrogenifigens DSM 19370]